VTLLDTKAPAFSEAYLSRYIDIPFQKAERLLTNAPSESPVASRRATSRAFVSRSQCTATVGCFAS
jgi:hypothetical protein